MRKRTLSVAGFTLMLAFYAVLALSYAQPAHAQFSVHDRFVNFPVATVPFGPGEFQTYDAKWGIFGTVGESTLGITAIDTLRGRPSYHIEFRIDGGILFARVHDLHQSWLDAELLQSHRYDQNVDEVNYERHRVIDFLPDEGIWQQRIFRKNRTVEDEGPLPTDAPLDDISFIYYARTLPLEVGQTYTFNRYWKESGNPVVLRVLRKEEITVPAGTFQTIVVKPIVQTEGMFAEDGEAEVYFTDDDRRLMVALHAKMSIGTLKLELKSFTPGGRLYQAPPKPDTTQR